MSRGELERIRWGPEPGQPVDHLGSVRLIARCAGNADEVLTKTRNVLETIIAETFVSNKELDRWRELLPGWLLQQFVPEPSKRDIEAYLRLPYEERMKPEHNRPSLANWLYWFQPENRYWFWWDATVVDENTIIVAIVVTEWPFPWASLKWLLRAAGATSVEPEP